MTILVLGSEEVVTALALAGLPGRAVSGAGGLQAALEDPMLLEGVRLLVVEEGVAALDRAAFDRRKLDPEGPLIVEIPGIGGPSSERRTALEMVRHALGIKLKES